MNNLKQQFKEVIEYSQDIEMCDADELWEAWAENKKRFIDKWGGLTYELPQEVVFDKTNSEKELIMKDFINDILCFTDSSVSAELKDFISKQGVEGFFSNRVIEKWTGEGKKIDKNSKISKSLKLFIKDSYFLEKFQSRLSRNIQDCKISGKLVISVHPLDFLSSSENVHNWHSCHALDGEYRSGNVSYMVDKHTFMVYLKSDKDSRLPNFPFKWNSKKWRVLMYASEKEDIIVKSREYPFSSEFALETVKEQLIDKFFDTSNFTEKWTNVSNTIRLIMTDGIGSMQYNDCLNSPSYSPTALYKKDLNLNSIEKADRMVIGEATPCLQCGGMPISLSSGFVCDECGEYLCCDCCGETMVEDECYYVDDEILCESCFDDQVAYCDECDESFNHNGEFDLIYDEENMCYYCECCYSQIMEARREEENEDLDLGEL